MAWWGPVTFLENGTSSVKTSPSPDLDSDFLFTVVISIIHLSFTQKEGVFNVHLLDVEAT